MVAFSFFPYLVCASPNLGVSVSPQKVSNSAMMHSTCYSTTQGYKARLNYYPYGWHPTHDDQLAVLKIDFGAAKKKITAIAVQSGLGYFVSAYEISYSVDGCSWRHWIEHGREKVMKKTDWVGRLRGRGGGGHEERMPFRFS